MVGRRDQETRGTDRRRREGKRERREVGKTEGSGEERREEVVKRGGRGVAKREWSGEERRDGSGEGTRDGRVEVIGSADGHRKHKSMQKSQHRD